MSNEIVENVPFLKIHRAWLAWKQDTASPQPRIRISSAHDEWNHVVVPLIGLAKGFFADQGLQDVELVTLESEDASLEALSRGQVDFALDPATPYVLRNIHKGADIYIIGPRRATHAFHLFGQKGMRSVRDLKDGKINVFTPGDEMTIQAAQIIRDAGMIPGVDVKITYYEGPMHDIFGMEEDFRQEKTQGLLAADVQVERLKADGYPVLVNLQEAYLPRQDRVMVATGHMVNHHPDTAKAFMKAMIRGNRFFLDRKNRTEITEIVKQAGFAIEKPKLFDAIFDALYTRIPPDCHLPLQGIEQAIAEQVQAGQIDTSITVERIVRIEPLRQAQKELGLG